MVDIKINAQTPGFTKPEIILIRVFDIQERSLKFNQSVCHVKMYFLTFEKPVFISGVDGVISIWTKHRLNVSFGLIFIKTNVQNDNSPKMW